MLKNIIFDFGDIFINLDKTATVRKMTHYGFSEVTTEMDHLFKSYEKGLMANETFLNQIQSLFPKATKHDLINAWNAILLDFPESRLLFLEEFARKDQYRLFLLSNTNDLHITWVRQQLGGQKFERFKKCFEKFYLSHEIHLRKPDPEIYEFVMTENNLVADETFFVDDTKENTDAASALGIRTWNLKVGKQDITELELFL
ncbi:MAG: HAD-IA family hydrolase [Bacteroidota bacterium]